MSKPSGHISSSGIIRNSIATSHDSTSESTIHGIDKTYVMKSFQPFIFDGCVSLADDSSTSTPIRILRDTGSSQSLILADTLPFSSSSYTGAHVLIQGVESDENCTSVPLHRLHLSSSVVTGSVVVGLRSSLPFKGIQLLLGNDLAGDKVVVNPVLTDIPTLDPPRDPLESEIPVLYPACVVTRAMAKKGLQEPNADDADLSDVSLMKETDTCADTDSGSNGNSITDDKIEMKTLCEQQHSDPHIAELFHKVVDEKDVSQEPVCFYTKHGVLMRKWRPPSVPADEEWTVHHQVVVPRPYQNEILMLAHETPLSGHLGVTKTYNKVLKHFYWPHLKRDVAEFCRSCHTCQVVGKPNQTIPKAKLQPIPAFEEPFSRVMVDCVGPLPRTRSGNEYMLTTMCASTRFPEAIPLRNIKARTIVKALIKFFTLVGLPKSIQSDQGSNFMSGIFKEVMQELGIKQYKSSAYHPESQGALERFHQTLKNMLRSYCFDTEKAWDEGVHLLLFAV